MFVLLSWVFLWYPSAGFFVEVYITCWSGCYEGISLGVVGEPYACKVFTEGAVVGGLNIGSFTELLTERLTYGFGFVAVGIFDVVVSNDDDFDDCVVF